MEVSGVLDQERRSIGEVRRLRDAEPKCACDRSTGCCGSNGEASGERRDHGEGLLLRRGRGGVWFVGCGADGEPGAGDVLIWRYGVDGNRRVGLQFWGEAGSRHSCAVVKRTTCVPSDSVEGAERASIRYGGSEAFGGRLVSSDSVEGAERASIRYGGSEAFGGRLVSSDSIEGAERASVRVGGSKADRRRLVSSDSASGACKILVRRAGACLGCKPSTCVLVRRSCAGSGDDSFAAQRRIASRLVFTQRSDASITCHRREGE